MMYENDDYYLGKAAFREGHALDECPFHYGSNEYEDWMNGYTDAEGERSLGID